MSLPLFRAFHFGMMPIAQFEPKTATDSSLDPYQRATVSPQLLCLTSLRLIINGIRTLNLKVALPYPYNYVNFKLKIRLSNLNLPIKLTIKP